MLFTLFCLDRPNRLDTRLAARESHLRYIAAYAEKVVHAGPLLDNDNRPCGSLLVIDVEDRAAAEGFAASDPYAKVDLFESVVIRGHRMLYRDGALVE
ncbi:YciI family protein [Rhizosaccharibacter radicis]|uniref:YciI family protein n=1 Tax=Rhizosaccharibacter radicis TaxID=2782605 RepID=A0ABT1W0G8_9PROT|nr:YciI family protein [Acetobacteraceae bacterium KSS12]